MKHQFSLSVLCIVAASACKIQSQGSKVQGASTNTDTASDSSASSLSIELSGPQPIDCETSVVRDANNLKIANLVSVANRIKTLGQYYATCDKSAADGGGKCQLPGGQGASDDACFVDLDASGSVNGMSALEEMKNCGKFFRYGGYARLNIKGIGLEMTASVIPAPNEKLTDASPVHSWSNVRFKLPCPTGSTGVCPHQKSAYNPSYQSDPGSVVGRELQFTATKLDPSNPQHLESLSQFVREKCGAPAGYSINNSFMGSANGSVESSTPATSPTASNEADDFDGIPSAEDHCPGTDVFIGTPGKENTRPIHKTGMYAGCVEGQVPVR